MTINFPDLSHFVVVPLDGAVALITKATQGAKFVDPTYAAYRRDALARGIPFAGYHYVDTADVAAQAAHAYAVMGSTPCMWDAEADGATVARLAELTKAYRAVGGNPRLVYLPHWWWHDHLGSPDLRPLAQLGLALVSSAYPDTGYSNTGVGWLPYGGVTPQIWQWTDAAPFNGARVDMNAFKGTVEQLRALFEGEHDMPSEFHTGDPDGPFLTQGNKGYAGQQRDTALAFAWEAAHNANENAAAARAAAEAALAGVQQIITALGGGQGPAGVAAHTHAGGTTGPVSETP